MCEQTAQVDVGWAFDVQIPAATSCRVSLPIITLTFACANKECARKPKLYGSTLSITICG